MVKIVKLKADYNDVEDVKTLVSQNEMIKKLESFIKEEKPLITFQNDMFNESISVQVEEKFYLKHKELFEGMGLKEQK